MNRVLLIDRDLDFVRALSAACVESDIAIRMAENLCEGVRYMLHAPVSAVLIEASLLRLAGPDQARLFDIVAPGVPVLVMVPADTSTGERARLELQGFGVMVKPSDASEILAKVEPLARTAATRAATARVDAICG